MATPTKTDGITVLALQTVAAGAVLMSADIDLTSKFAYAFYTHMGRRVTTALTTGVNFRVDVKCRTGCWSPIPLFSSDIATAESEAVNGTCAAGQNVVPVASTTNLVIGDIVFISNPTIGNSEWGRIKAVTTNTSITLEDNLVYAQTGATVYDQGHMFTPAVIDVSAYKTIRFVVDNTGTGQEIAVEVTGSSLDSVG